MSYDFIVYTRRERLPSSSQLAESLATLSPPVVLHDRFPDADRRGGFLPASIGARRLGVDVLYATIKASEAADFEADLIANDEPSTPEDTAFLTILRTCDLSITVSGKTADEIHAARLVSTALASASAGHLCDPQADVMVDLPPPGSR